MERDDAWRLTDRVIHKTGKGDPFAAAVRATRMAMIITNPHHDDNPIVFANDAFLKLTGYGRDEVMGRNCRFLQGEDTDRDDITKVAEAIKARRDIDIDLLNYRKDGTAFWNALYVSPVFNEADKIQFFFASQLDVTDRKDALAVKTALLHEVDHRVKNNLMMVSALLTMHIKTMADPEVRTSLQTLMGRVEALSTVHRRLYQSDDVTRFSVAGFVQDIVTELVGTTGRKDIGLLLDLDPVDVSAEKASLLALMVNELVTNVLKHALPPDRPGRIAISVKRDDERLQVKIEDDGVGMPIEPSASKTAFGHGLIRMLARQLRADVTWSAVEPSGTCVDIILPTEQLARGA